MLCPVKKAGTRIDRCIFGLITYVRLTTGPMRSSSEGFSGTFELGSVWAGVDRELATIAGGRGAAGGGGGAAETVGFGASQASTGTREAAAAPPTRVVRVGGPEEGGA